MRIYIRKFEEHKQTVYYYINIIDKVTDTLPEATLYSYKINVFDKNKYRPTWKTNLLIKYINKYNQYKEAHNAISVEDNYQIKVVTDEHKHPNTVLIPWTTINKSTARAIVNKLQLAMALNHIDRYI